MDTTEFYEKWFSVRLGGTPTISKRILFNEALLRVRRELAATSRRLDLLDVGCGAGHFVERLLALERVRVTGVDITADVLDCCRRRFPQATFQTRDFSAPQELEAAADVVTAVEVIEHVPYIQQPVFIANCAKVLRPGGMLVLTTPNADRREQIPAVHRNTQPVEDWLTPDQVQGLLAGAFADIELGSCIWFFPNRIVDALFKRICYPFHMTLEQRLLRATRRGCHLVACARRRG